MSADCLVGGRRRKRATVERVRAPILDFCLIEPATAVTSDLNPAVQSIPGLVTGSNRLAADCNCLAALVQTVSDQRGNQILAQDAGDRRCVTDTIRRAGVKEVERVGTAMRRTDAAFMR